MSITNYKELIVWQKSRVLVKKGYVLSDKFPKSERYVLTDQLHRALISIPSNIAEGFQRQTQREFTQFLYHAFGSSAEVETQLLLAIDLGYVKQEEVQEILLLLNEIQKMLKSLILKSKEKSKD